MKAWVALLVGCVGVGCGDPSDPVEPADAAVDGSDTATDSLEAAVDSGVDSQPADTKVDAPADTKVDAPFDVGTYADAFGPTATIEGKDYTAWSVEWWKWLIAIPEAKNPVNGGDCQQGQSGDVWFLAGSSAGPAVRMCKIPAGKVLLFPLSNSICFPCHEDEGCSTTKTEAELSACAALDPAKSLSATIDGVPIAGLEAHHFATKQFSFKGPSSDGIFGKCTGPIAANTCSVPEGDRYGVADGYWVALKPLSKGAHTLKFKSVVSSAGTEFTQDLTYLLAVE